MRTYPVFCFSLAVLLWSGLHVDAQAQQLARKTVIPGDLLTVIVPGHEDLSVSERPVDMMGGFSIPLAGRIESKGKSISEIQEIVNERLTSFVANAEAVVFFAEYSRLTLVTVDGRVNTPGEVFFKEGEWPNLMAAINHAGGATHSHSTVRVVRNGRLIYEGSVGAIGDGRASRVTLQTNDSVSIH